MFTSEEILKVTGGTEISGGKPRSIAGVSIDTRTIRAGELFIPIKGKNYNGGDFIPAALKKGGYALKVKNGLAALKKLAAFHRRKFDIPVIGITGSCGKTTTKEMLHSIFSQERKTLKNEENFNNEIGVPLTLLKLTKEHRAAVIEMALQKRGEMKELAEIVRPTVAVITNIGEAHLKFLKTKKNVARAKAEIFHFLRPGNFAVINRDDKYFQYLMSNVKCQMSNVASFGIVGKAEVSPKDLKGIKLPVPGEYNTYNALAAIAAAKIVGVKKSSVKKGLEAFAPSRGRAKSIERPDGIRIIDDTYNANPSSMTAALKALISPANLSRRKIAVLGEMLELGASARMAHHRILKLARELKVDRVYAFGKLWPREAGAEKDKSSLIKNLRKFMRPRDIILVKGSRGTKMEEVAEALI